MSNLLVWVAVWVLAIAALPSSALAAKGSFQRSKPHVNAQTLFPFAEIPGLGTASITAGVMLFDTGVARGHVGFVTLEGSTLLFRPLLGEFVENSDAGASSSCRAFSWRTARFGWFAEEPPLLSMPCNP